MRAPRSSYAVARAVVAFLLAGALAVAIIAAATLLLWRHQAERQAIGNARMLTTVEARDVVGPALTDAALMPGTAANERLNALVRAHVVDADVVRLKIWAPDGTVVYSDDHSLVGSRFSLGKDAQEALYGSTPFAEVSNLRAPENRAERHFGKLLEVYLGVRTDSGRPLLFETYQRYDAITRSSRRIMQGALPALLVGLTLLYTVQAPLAYGLASRLRRAQREREQALLDTLAVSDRERRRIAADLHDGVVQGLAGVSYTLSAAGDRAEAAGDAADASLLRGAAQDLRSWVRELRTLVVTIAPPTLHRAGLSAALEDLRGTLSSRGVEVSTAIDTLPPLPPQVETLAFRVAQEAVRNIIKHARATSVTLSAGLTDGVLSVEIADDGCGLSAAGGATHDGGHGLALLTDLTRSQGGDLTVSAGADGTGTTVLLLVPTDEGSPPAQRVPSARRPVAAP